VDAIQVAVGELEVARPTGDKRVSQPEADIGESYTYVAPVAMTRASLALRISWASTLTPT
jgi:hypothetical protein